MATKSQEILLKGNTTNASAVPSSLKVREIAINALDRSLFTNDGNNIVKLYTGTTKWFDVNGNANNALKLGGILASEYINKEAFNSHINNSTIHITSAERNAWNNKWDYDEETIKGIKVNAAVSADTLTSNAGTSAIPIYFDGGIPVQCTPADLFSRLGNINQQGGLLAITIAGITRSVMVLHSVLSDKAAKLQTARTLWGRLFDGSANVDGDLKDVGNITASGKATIQGDIISGGEVAAIVGDGTPAGVTDYSALTGKPSINGITLVSGNNTLAALGIQAAGDYATNSGVTTLLADYAKKTFVANNYAGKAAFNNHTADSVIHITSAERTAWNAKWTYDEATIKEVKVNAAVSADKLTTDKGTSAIPIYFKNGKPAQCIPSDLFSGFGNAYSSTETSLGITIAGHTRMVVVAYSQTAGSVAWTGITDKPSTFTPSAHTHTASEISGLPTSLKNPYALTFGSKTYDGSAAASITASDLGALTAHQTIYALTLQVNGTSKGTYNPTSAAKTINIAVPTKTSEITNDSGFITSASIPTALKNPYAVEIKANGVSLGTYDGSKAATFNLSAANVGAASKIHTHTASEITGLPTKLSAFTNDVGFITGITKSMVEGVLTGDITSHTHSYLPLSGGTLTGSVTIQGFNETFIRNITSTSYVGGWAGSLIDLQVDGVSKFRVSCFGDYTAGASNNGIKYGYIGCNSYNGLNLRISATSISWGDNPILHSGNYNSYAPTLTGTGASGTWGISISGNAATATNADTLDNLHAADFAKVKSHIVSGTDVNSIGYGVTDDGNMYYGPMATFGTADYFIEIQSPYNKPELYYRQYNTNGYSDKKRFAFTDSNVASATKLQTPRTIWGQSFDGTGDISGHLTLNNNRALRCYDTEGNTHQVIKFTTFNSLAIGAGSASASKDTYIYGNNLVFRYGADVGTAIFINSSGNVTIGSSDLASTTTKLYVDGTGHYTGDLIVDGEVSALVA